MNLSSIIVCSLQLGQDTSPTLDLSTDLGTTKNAQWIHATEKRSQAIYRENK